MPMPDTSPATGVRVSVSQQAPWLLPLSRRELHAALALMLARAPRPLPFSALEVTICRDSASAATNMRAMGRQGATNILSFPAPPPSVHEAMPACLLLNADAVRREALLYTQDVGRHSLHLLAHGLCHVLGYEHGPEMDALCDTLLACALPPQNGQSEAR